jgi:hypothetical protein
VRISAASEHQKLEVAYLAGISSNKLIGCGKDDAFDLSPSDKHAALYDFLPHAIEVIRHVDLAAEKTEALTRGLPALAMMNASPLAARSTSRDK